MLSYRSIRTLPARKLTRLAPTPSGYLHLGNILSFAITCHFAARTGARILLRIDDLDQLRTQDAYIDDIFSSLQFLGIPWHMGPANTDDFKKNWSQQSRMQAYEKKLNALRSAGLLFGCQCTRSQLAESRSIHSLEQSAGYQGNCINKNIDLDAPETQWRVFTDPERMISVNRLGAGELKNNLPSEMNCFSARRKDGIPAYQLASLVDDEFFGVDLIVRGVDLWPSSWAQAYLSACFETDYLASVQFVHHPLLLDRQASKMSKSAGAESVQSLRANGASPEDIFTEIARWMGSDRPCYDWMQLALLAETTFSP